MRSCDAWAKLCSFNQCTKNMKNWVLVSLPVSGSQVPSVVQLCVFVVSCHAVCLAHGRVTRTLAMLVQTQEASRRCSKSKTKQQFCIEYSVSCVSRPILVENTHWMVTSGAIERLKGDWKALSTWVKGQSKYQKCTWLSWMGAVLREVPHRWFPLGCCQ